MEEDQDGVLSADEFYTALKAEYLKCDLILDVELPHDVPVHTTDMLEDAIQLAHHIADGITITTYPAEKIVTGTRDARQLRVMEADFSYSRTALVSCSEFPLFGTFGF